MTTPKLLPCAHCGREVELDLAILDDDHKYPRPHWHARIECDCGIALDWGVVSEQLPDYHSDQDRSKIDQKSVDDFCAVWNRRPLRLPRREGWFALRGVGTVRISRLGRAWFATPYDQVGGTPQGAAMVLSQAEWITAVSEL